MKIDRSSGVLLHITSLPGKYGIGTLGDEAKKFAHIMTESGLKYWQILPIGPVSPAHAYSPYSSTSTFAGNFLFISIEKLLMEEWFKSSINISNNPEDAEINFDLVVNCKSKLLETAASDFYAFASKKDKNDFEEFCSRSDYWLDDFALFSSLSEHFKTNSWIEWETNISNRKPSSMEMWNERLKKRINYYKFQQFIFFKQWNEFKDYCGKKKIKIIGDIPIYVNFDSCDAWSHREIFQLDEKNGNPVSVSGVPPDYFSDTGQRWGNPLYRWADNDKKLYRPTIDWWEKRIDHLSKIVDIIRIDHFRGFEAYWSIPGKEKTAIKGKWIKGPGIEFFHELKKGLTNLNLIAEDLGVITPEVEKLRDDLGLPGMKILQFAFDFNNKNYYLPHNINNKNCILYTGTHDNNTTNGWFYGDEIDDTKRNYIMDYLGTENFSNINWQLIRLAYRSVANLVIIPAQDITGFGKEYRMNKPGTINGNWKWKLRKNDISNEHISLLKSMGIMYNRIEEDAPDNKS